MKGNFAQRKGLVVREEEVEMLMVLVFLVEGDHATHLFLRTL